jgi:hypothetical protein
MIHEPGGRGAGDRDLSARRLAGAYPDQRDLQPADPAVISVVDVIPNSDSSETFGNSEPSLGVDPLNPLQMIAGMFGAKPGSSHQLLGSAVSIGTTFGWHRR